MDLIVKHFSELTAEELFEIYRLRVAVFVVEQNCPYQEVDEPDREAYHLWLRDKEGIQAYLRVLKPGVRFHEAAIGRVIAVRRREGLGSRILRDGIRVAQERFGASAVRLEAQVYAKGLYEKAGFRAVSEEFLEDGIPHVEMLLELK